MYENYLIEMCWRYICYCQSDKQFLNNSRIFDKNAQVTLGRVSDHICEIMAFIKVRRHEFSIYHRDLFTELMTEFASMYRSYSVRYEGFYEQKYALDEDFIKIIQEVRC